MLKINLPPIIYNSKLIEQFLKLSIVDYKFINPSKYGHINAKIKVSHSSFDVYKKELSKLYEEKKDLCLGQGKDYLIVYPQEKSLVGNIYFISSKFPKINFKDEQIKTLMKLLNSPLSYSATEEMYYKFQLRDIKRKGYTEQIYTVRNYSEGLTNAFWRMWFGKEYINFFEKDELDKAPAFYKNYSDGIYFIQLFETPYDWNTKDGIKITEEFKRAVGIDAFYDPQNPEKKLKAPDFKHLLNLKK